MHFVKDGRTIFIAIFKTQYSKLNIRVIKCRHFLEPVKKCSMQDWTSCSIYDLFFLMESTGFGGR